MSRIASLDLVRSGASLIVAIPHFFIFNHMAPETFEAISIIGVEVFFVLSGYVLAPQILACIKRPDELPIFLVRRWMRTIPAYVLALVCISLLFSKFGSADFVRYLFYVQNLVTQSNEVDYFPVAWSLSVEEWFYVLFPLWMLGSSLCLKSKNYATLMIVAVVFIIAVTAARATFADLSSWGPQVRRVVIFRVDSIAYGFLLYNLIHRMPRRVASIATLVSAAVVLCVAPIAYWNAIEISSDNAIGAKYAFPFMAAFLGCALILLAVKTEMIVSRRKRLAQIAVFGGKISYSVYLFHIIFIVALSPAMKSFPLAIQLFIYLSSTILFAYIFYVNFEYPILSARPNFRDDIRVK